MCHEKTFVVITHAFIFCDVASPPSVLGAVTRGHLKHVRAQFPAGGGGGRAKHSQQMPVTSLCTETL
jgi:hypothetical protein